MAAAATAGTLDTPSLLNIAELFDFEDFASQEWRRHAACRGQDPSFWHPRRGVSIEPQKAICRGCPVRVDCLTYALDHAGANFGIWGGSTGRNRRRARRRGWDARQLLAELDGHG
jgi:WhiB family redox-sensing transcriptional regulator